MKESALRTKIVKALNSYAGSGKIFFYVNHQTMYGTVGIADITGCYRGNFYALEVKLPGKEHELTPRQSLFLQKIRKAGGKAAMVTSVDQAMTFVFDSIP